MFSHDLARRGAIGLVIEQGPDVALTDAGQQRMRSLPSTDEQLVKLLKVLNQDGI